MLRSLPSLNDGGSVAKFCCERMERWSQPQGEAQMAIIHHSRSRCNYGIRENAGGNAFIAIAHCPWCGTKLKMDEALVGRRMVEAH